jgi:hypothetical protein
MKDSFYFSHDSNANRDPKITKMRSVYGAEGYGWFWMIIEMMRESENYKLDIKSKYVFDAYAMQMQCERIKLIDYINDCIHEFELFDTDDDYIWSNSLLKRMKIKDEKSQKAKESANKRWNNTTMDANALKKDANAQKNDAYKERKGKDIKDKQVYRKFDHLSLSLSEYERIIEEGYTKQEIDSMLDSIENYKKNTSYKSLNLTLKKWLKKEEEDAKLITSTKNTGFRLYQTESERKQIKPEVKPSKYFTPEMYEM